MATLKEAIEYSRKNPQSDFARMLKQRIQSGEADQDFAKEGIDPTTFGRQPVVVSQTVVEEPVPQEKPLTSKIADIWNKGADSVGAARARQAAGTQTSGETAFQTVTGGLGAVGETAFELAKATPVLGTGIEKLEQGIGAVTEAAIENVPGIAGAFNKASEIWEGLDERTKANLGGVGELASWLTGGVAGKGAKKVGEKAIEKGVETAAGAAKLAGQGAEVVKDVAGAAADKAMTARPVKAIVNKVGDVLDERATRKDIATRGRAALDVYDETGSPEFISMVDRTKGPEDLAVKSKMLDIAEERMKGGASAKLPRQVIAEDYVVPRINLLEGRLKEVGKTIQDAGKDNTIVDTTDVFNIIRQEAQKQGVIVSVGKNGKLTFSKQPGVSGIDQTRINTIKGLFDGFRPDPKTGVVTNTKAQLADTRKNLSALTKRTDAAKEVVSPGGPVDNARRAIAQKIGGEYFAATKEYADIIRTLKKLDPDLDVRLSEDAVEDITNVKVSDYARRLLSNNAAQAKSVFTSLDELYKKEAARLGLEVADQDLADLVDFAGALEEGFGITPRNTFFGQSKAANQASGVGTSIAVDAATGGAPVATTLNTLRNIIKNPGRNDKRALAAMKSYLKEVQAKLK